MKLATFNYTKNEGWTVKTFPNLDSENTLVLIFAAPEFVSNPEIINELASHYPKSKIIGCSSAGEISGSHILDKSITVAVAKFEKTPIKIVNSEIKSSKNSRAAGQEIIKQLSNPDLRGVFVLADGLKVNGSELVKGLNTLNKGNVTITGGLAGDGSRFKQTWAIFNGKIVMNNVIAVGFYGEHIQIGHASRGGWDIFGPQRVVTRSDHNVVFELDGKPALALYKEYLGERASGLPATGLLFPLAIRQNQEDNNPLVRTILAVDEKNQSLTFAGDVPTGYYAQFMRANFDRLITAADEAGEVAVKEFSFENNTPLLAIAVSCVGRRLLLGERTEEETESTLNAMPKNTVQVGFYSYGELSPLFTSGDCAFHNQTMTLTTFTEKVE